MKTANRPQYHRLQRILELIREGTRSGSLPNCGHFTRELAVSRRGATGSLLRATSLADGDWQTGTSSIITTTATNWTVPVTDSSAFYRLRLE